MKLQDLLVPSDILSNTMPIVSISQYNTLSEIQFDAIILGYNEYRNSDYSKSIDNTYNIRKQLYSLFGFSQNCKIVDVGDCKKGKTVKESYIVLQEVVAQLKKYDKPIVIFGGSQEASVTIATELFKNLKYPTYTTIDSRLDIDESDKDFSSEKYLDKLLDINKSIRIVNIGNQEYLSSPEAFSWFEMNYFPLYRLGKLRNKILETEPLIRDAQLVSIDVKSIRNSDFPSIANKNAVGLNAEEVSQIAWYSGYSPKMQITHISNYFQDTENDICSLVFAQIIWHILDGISQRKQKTLDFSAENYKCFYVKNSFLDQDLRFFEHYLSQQLWVEVPLQSKNEKRIIPCSASDYQDFMTDNLSEFWLMEFNRIYKK